MKNYFLVIALMWMSFEFYGQQEAIYNEQNGFIAKGYDVVSYFEKKPEKGIFNFKVNYKGAHLMFSSQVHLELFNSDPEKYFPQYGGWCAYAMAVSGQKVHVNPKTYEIRDAKLYLFYNRYFDNTYSKWLNENPEKLGLQADKYWDQIKNSL